MIISAFVFITSFALLFISSWNFLNCAKPKQLASSFAEEDPTIVQWFMIGLAWISSLGVFGLLTSLGFYANLAYSLHRWLILAIAIIGFMMLKLALLKNEKFPMPTLKQAQLQVEKWELLLLLSFLGLSAYYAFRTFVPWWDHDEISQYGYFSKLISQDWTFNGMFKYLHDGNTKFSESLFAHLVNISHSNFAARVFKFINLEALMLTLYFFLRLNSVKRGFALLAINLAIATPELSYLATSMKVDSTLMLFETTSYFLSLQVLFNINAKRAEDLAWNGYLSSLACCIAYFAVATRLSGVHCALIATGIFILTQILAYRQERKLIPGPLIATTLLAILCAHPFIFHFIEFKNPLFPFKLAFLPAGAEGNVDYSNWKDTLNLILDWPPVLYHAYLLTHISLGLETISSPFLAFIPHAIQRGSSLGWLSPCLFLLLFTPLLYQRKKIKAPIMIALFFAIFFIWSAGIQLTRVFLAGNIIGVSALIMMLAQANPNQKWKNALKQLMLLGCALIVAFCHYYQIRHIKKNYFLNPISVFQQQAAYEFKHKVAYHDINFAYAITPKFQLPTYNDVQKIDEITQGIEQPKILGINFTKLLYQSYYHIFFNRILFKHATVNDNNYTQIEVIGHASFRSATQDEFDCIMINRDTPEAKQAEARIYELFKAVYPNLRYQSEQDHFSLYCKL